MPTRTVRMIPPPPTSGHNPLTVNARTYSGPVANPVDIPEVDAEVAAGNAWTRLGMVGTTAQRPSPQDSDFQNGIPSGFRYIDTTIPAAILYDAQNKLWRHAVTGAAV
jgi:hypothetical protein